MGREVIEALLSQLQSEQEQWILKLGYRQKVHEKLHLFVTSHVAVLHKIISLRK